MGDSGTGTAAKLVNQLLVGIHATAAAEALSFAESLNLNLNAENMLLPLLKESWGSSKVLNRCGAIISQQCNGNFTDQSLENSGAPLKNLVKDLKVGNFVQIGTLSFFFFFMI